MVYLSKVYRHASSGYYLGTVPSSGAVVHAQRLANGAFVSLASWSNGQVARQPPYQQPVRAAIQPAAPYRAPTAQPAATQSGSVAAAMRATGWVRVYSNVTAPDLSFKNYKFSSVQLAEKAIADLTSRGQYGGRCESCRAATMMGNPPSVLALINR